MIGNRGQASVSQDVLFGYLERSIEELGLRMWFSLLRPGKEEWFREKFYMAESNILNYRPWVKDRDSILGHPQDGGQWRWEPRDESDEDIWAYYRTNAAMVAALMGDREAFLTLAAQLVTEPMNRKLWISYFLGNLTTGRVGSPFKELPTKSDILGWLKEIPHVKITDRLEEMAALKAGYSKGDTVAGA